MRRLLFLTVSLSLVAVGAQASDKDKEPTAILEIGGAAERTFPDGDTSTGPSVAVEFTFIKDWLEIEGGLSRLSSSRNSEWSTYILAHGVHAGLSAFRVLLPCAVHAAPGARDATLRAPTMPLWPARPARAPLLIFTTKIGTAIGLPDLPRRRCTPVSAACRWGCEAAGVCSRVFRATEST